MEAGIKLKPITPYTPTANSIIKATHKTVAQVIRTLVHLIPPKIEEEAQALVKQAIATVIHSHQCSVNSVLGGLSPGSVAFNQDMLLNLPLIIDINLLHTYCQPRLTKP